MKNLIVTTALALLALSFLGCGAMEQTVDRKAEIETVSATIKGCITWCIPDKDRDRLYAHRVKDSTFFIFHPTSRSTIHGFDEFKAYAERIFFDPRFKATSVDIKDLRVNLSKRGDVAWFSCLLDDQGEWDGQPVGWKDARWTGVLVKEDGVWLMAQEHFSLPTDAPQE